MVVEKSVEDSLAVDVKSIIVLASTGIVVLITVVENVMNVEETGGALSVTVAGMDVNFSVALLVTV